MTESVKDILARSAEGHTLAAVEAAHSDLAAKADLLGKLFAAARPEEGSDDWRLIHAAVFRHGPGEGPTIGDEVEGTLTRVGRALPDYLVPDEGYADDVRAWKDAFDEAFADLTRDLEALRAAECEARPVCR